MSEILVPNLCVSKNVHAEMILTAIDERNCAIKITFIRKIKVLIENSTFLQ